ncbi:AraC family transcriptional regulator [Paraflavitalea speifideaquila]|uniref:helix-turn-helix domain-containing protein n=1 Tax=Paraflavitalea speifideaquila TaxID=3076558 RepID=UPI0028E89FA3|nr:AraC family transcriptional regulator [Paraflavitalea speifideiaquila]
MVYDIHFSRSHLEKLQSHFPYLAEFLIKTELGLPCQLSPVHAHITPDMMTILHNMHYCLYTGNLKSTYLEALLLRLLLMALTRLMMVKIPVNEVKLQPYELAKLREAWEYLLHHLDHPGTLMDLSYTIGLNDFKLKKGFKQLYGITIFEFLLEARMEKARRLLQETTMTVHAVAISVGYKNISSFTVAFKKNSASCPVKYRAMITGGTRILNRGGRYYGIVLGVEQALQPSGSPNKRWLIFSSPASALNFLKSTICWWSLSGSVNSSINNWLSACSSVQACRVALSEAVE